MSRSVLLGRGQVLGTFRETAELSAAFGADRQSHLALPADGTDALSEDGVDVAADAVATLVSAIHERVDMDIWIWGYGEGPDDLVTLSHARARFPDVDDAFEDAGEDEVISLLAILAGASTSEPRLVSRRVRSLVGEATTVTPPCQLAMRASAEGVARRFRAFRARGGPDLPFWTADRTLGVRFSVRRNSVSFRAHHPVIQEELVHRCGREGIDLE